MRCAVNRKGVWNVGDKERRVLGKGERERHRHRDIQRETQHPLAEIIKIKC